MLLGTLLDDEEAAGGIGIVVSMAFAALGGAMLPIELFGDAMVRVARPRRTTGPSMPSPS